MRLRTSKHIHRGVYIERADTEIARKLPDVWVCEEMSTDKKQQGPLHHLAQLFTNNTKLINDAPTRSREIKFDSF